MPVVLPILSVVFPALLFAAAIASVQGARGSLARNRYFGIRSSAAMRSDAAWVVAHRAAIVPSWVGFVIVAAMSVASWLAPSEGDRPTKFALVVVFAIFAIAIFAVADQAARAVDPASS